MQKETYNLWEAVRYIGCRRVDQGFVGFLDMCVENNENATDISDVDAQTTPFGLVAIFDVDSKKGVIYLLE
jgi:hypothetical protein